MLTTAAVANDTAVLFLGQHGLESQEEVVHHTSTSKTSMFFVLRDVLNGWRYYTRIFLSLKFGLLAIVYQELEVQAYDYDSSGHSKKTSCTTFLFISFTRSSSTKIGQQPYGNIALKFSMI